VEPANAAPTVPATRPSPAQADSPATVQLTVPASAEFLSLVRTATAGVAARLNLTIDEVEDLRLAADEAGSLVLSTAPPGSALTVTFTLGADELRAQFAAPTTTATPPDEAGFGWTVLAALAGSVHADVSDGILRIDLTHARAGQNA
jgi:serine/threonine-protein kinase RsbW